MKGIGSKTLVILEQIAREGVYQTEAFQVVTRSNPLPKLLRQELITHNPAGSGWILTDKGRDLLRQESKL